MSYRFRKSHPAFSFRALSHRVLTDPHLTRRFADPDCDSQNTHSRPVYVKTLWHNFAWQCSHEQIACLAEKANLFNVAYGVYRYPNSTGWGHHELLFDTSNDSSSFTASNAASRVLYSRFHLNLFVRRRNAPDVAQPARKGLQDLKVL